MTAGKRMRMGVAASALAIAMAGLAAIPAGATRTVSIPSTLQISAYGYLGKVKSSNSGCVEARTVVLKQKGHGILGRTKSTDTGKWEVSPEGIHYKGQLPYKIYAEVKPLSQGTAGTIYKCLGATSKTIEIAGG
ncbi:MAG TPA: hypothetical protein VLK56_05735 [Solirubrobacterales bacterium]|nr:hypothetical protein [Solirubrobacterales bacterium]